MIESEQSFCKFRCFYTILQLEVLVKDIRGPYVTGRQAVCEDIHVSGIKKEASTLEGALRDFINLEAAFL